jgi:hypothetical protein
MSQTFTSPFTGTVIEPTDVSYVSLNFATTTQLYWPQVVDTQLGQTATARIMDCIPATSALTLILPNAEQGSLGTDILVRNIGAFSFTVVDATLDNGVTVDPGKAIYFYLTNNTVDIGGTWGIINFGVGTSSADASSLAGAGLTTVNGQLATAQNPVDITVTPTLDNTSLAVTYVWNGGAGAFTLPDPATLLDGWYIGFRNNGTGALSITPQAPALINGATTITANPGDSGFILFDNTLAGYVTVGLTAPSAAAFTAATYDVDSIVGPTLSLVNFAPIIQTYIAQSGTRTTTLTVTIPAITQIYILANSTNQTGYNINFTVQGSSSPAFILPTGTVVAVLSDGINIYPLTEAPLGLFYATSGTAADPSYSFSADNESGMYLDGTSVLGLAANATEMLRIDNSNTSFPLITTPARIAAGLISGGTF